MGKQTGDLKRFLTLMLSSFTVALLVVAALLYFFGSSGTVLVKQVLVSPRAFVEEAPTDFVSNKIEFITKNRDGKGWGRFTVSLEGYRAFYDEIEHLRSLPHITESELDAFERVDASTLTLYHKGKNGEALFQKVEILEDRFRIQRRLSLEGEEEWIYFRKEGVYQDAFKQFVSSGS